MVMLAIALKYSRLVLHCINVLDCISTNINNNKNTCFKLEYEKSRWNLKYFLFTT